MLRSGPKSVVRTETVAASPRIRGSHRPRLAANLRTRRCHDHTELTDEEYEKFCGLIYRVAGIRIADNKRVMVSNRVRRRLRATGIASFTELLRLPDLARRQTARCRCSSTRSPPTRPTSSATPSITNGSATTFLPEIARQAALRKRPKTPADLVGGVQHRRRALLDRARRSWPRSRVFAGWRITILGTDLSGAVLAAARAGSYDARAVRLVEPARRLAFFDDDPAAQRWTIKPEVKALVTWKQHNLLFPLEEEPFDCIFHQECADLF